MNKLKYILISIPFYLIAVFSIVVYLITDIHPRVVISPEGRLVLLGIFCIFLYIGSRIICKVPAININKIMKTTFFIFFMLYLSLLLTFTLFDPMFGRNGTVNFILSDKMLLKNYLANSFNIIPFATVIEYVKALLACNSCIIQSSQLYNLIFFSIFSFATITTMNFRTFPHSKKKSFSSSSSVIPKLCSLPCPTLGNQ